jgi:hypothetical protein
VAFFWLGYPVSAGVVVRRVLTAALTTLAFWNSYTHTVHWFGVHGQEDAAQFLALIPEAGLILALLFAASGELTGPQKWLVGFVGFGSIGITISANLAGAPPGVAGSIAALVAPVFAILGFALEVTGPAKTGPVAVDQEPAQPGPVDQSGVDQSEPRTTRDRRTNVDQKSGPVAVVHPDQNTGPVRTTKPRTTRDRRTNVELLARINHLVHAGELPPNPSATRIRAALACNKTRAGQLRKDFATQADTPAAGAAG